MMRKREKLMNIGTKIIGNYGAMIPLWEGEVVTIETFTVGPELGNSDVKVRWDNGSHTWMLLSEIRDDYFDPKLPGIGYFAVDVDRAWDWVE